MKNHIVISIRITFVLLVITCGIYPLAVWAIGQAAFPDQANGSLIVRDKKIIGSSLIGQDFTGERFFHPRPGSYDPTASGGTNYGPTSKKLLDSIRERAAKYDGPKPIPADAVTGSCSGVDPHISPANAYAQAARVARANGLGLAQVRALIDRHTEGRFLGVFGAPRVNVLRINLELLK